jgi:hypothetical protein
VIGNVRESCCNLGRIVGVLLQESNGIGVNVLDGIVGGRFEERRHEALEERGPRHAARAPKRRDLKL